MKNIQTATRNKTKTLNQSLLTIDLSRFGLCPDDWIIELKQSSLAFIKNKQEQEFIFLGRPKDGLTGWDTIQLYSL